MVSTRLTVTCPLRFHLKTRLVRSIALSATGQPSRCAGGYVIEDFGASVNLTISASIKLIDGGPAECLDAIKVSRAPKAPFPFDDGFCEAVASRGLGMRDFSISSFSGSNIWLTSPEDASYLQWQRVEAMGAD